MTAEEHTELPAMQTPPTTSVFLSRTAKGETTWRVTVTAAASREEVDHAKDEALRVNRELKAEFG